MNKILVPYSGLTIIKNRSYLALMVYGSRIRGSTLHFQIYLASVCLNNNHGLACLFK